MAEVATAATDMPTTAPSTPAATAIITGTSTAIEQQPADIIVVTDVSGSMAANNKIAGVRTALANFADLLSPHDRIELITFSSTATVTLPMEPVEDARASVKQIQRTDARRRDDAVRHDFAGIQRKCRLTATQHISA